MKTITIDYPGLSLLEIREQYPKLFYNQSWYEYEAFAEEKAPVGKYELCVEPIGLYKNWKEQQKELEKGFEVPPVAVVAYGILKHFEETGERLFEDKYVRTSSLGSDGYRVIVGRFDAKGLYVYYYWVGDRNDDLGLASARKLETGNLVTFESLISRIVELEKFKNRVEGKI